MIAAWREAVRKRHTRLLQRPFWRLVSHFGMRLFSGTGDSSEGGLGLGVGAILALLAAPGAFVSILLLDKYSSLLRFFRGDHAFDPYAASLPDQYFFITLSMAITGIVTVLKWDSIFPDRRDYMNLAPLPVSIRQIVLANITAIIVIAVAFAVDVNAASSILFPMDVTMEMPEFIFFEKFAAAHFAGVLLASLFVFFAMFAMIGTLMATLPDGIFRRISLYVRVLIVVLLLGLLCTTFAVPQWLAATPGHSSLVLRWLPPVWFLGLARSLIGKADFRLAQFGYIGLYAVIGVSVMAPIVYTISYYRYFMRIPETLDVTLRNRAPRKFLPMQLIDRMLQSSFQRAIYRFALKTLLRNERHSLLFGAFAGLGLVIAAQTLVSALNQKTATSVVPDAGLLSVPFILAYFLICGLRFVFDLPAEIRANWVHQVILGSEDLPIAALARKVILTFVLPWVLLLCLPIYVYCCGWIIGTAHTVTLVIACYLLADGLLRRFRKIPFTCTYPAWKQNATVIILLYLLGLWGFAFLLPELEHALLVRNLFYLWGLPPVLLGIRLVFRKISDHQAPDCGLIFEDKDTPQFELLNLSGR